jgi:hypothetical protein
LSSVGGSPGRCFLKTSISDSSSRAVTGGTGVTLAAILTLLPRLGIAAVGAKVLARTTVAAVAPAIRRAARELLVTAKFSLRPIATRTVAVFTKTFATRRIGPLLATAFSRGIGLPVAKFPIGKTSGRAGIVAIPEVALAIPARGAVVSTKIRPVAAWLERTLLAAIIARAKILTRSAIPGVARAISGVGLAISEITGGAIIAVETLRTIAKIAARRTIIAIALAGVRSSATGIRLLAK